MNQDHLIRLTRLDGSPWYVFRDEIQAMETRPNGTWVVVPRDAGVVRESEREIASCVRVLGI